MRPFSRWKTLLIGTMVLGIVALFLLAAAFKPRYGSVEKYDGPRPFFGIVEQASGQALILLSSSSDLCSQGTGSAQMIQVSYSNLGSLLEGLIVNRDIGCERIRVAGPIEIAAILDVPIDQGLSSGLKEEGPLLDNPKASFYKVKQGLNTDDGYFVKLSKREIDIVRASYGSGEGSEVEHRYCSDCSSSGEPSSLSYQIFTVYYDAFPGW